MQTVYHVTLMAYYVQEQDWGLSHGKFQALISGKVTSPLTYRNIHTSTCLTLALKEKRQGESDEVQRSREAR